MQHVKNIMMKKISNIKKKNNKYIVTLDDNNHLEFYSDTLIKYNLLKPRNVSDNEFKEILEYNLFYEAFNKALSFISSKQRTKKELSTKLNGYSQNIINKVIKRLEDLGYLDEKMYIESFINDQINLGCKGPIYIKKTLEKLDLNPLYIEKSLNNVEKYIWQEKIDKLINKKIKTNNNLSKNNLILKIKSYLISLGYEQDMVKDMLNQVHFQEDASILEKEYQKELKKLSKKYKEAELTSKIKYNLYKKGFNLSDIENLQNKY